MYDWAVSDDGAWVWEITLFNWMGLQPGTIVMSMGEPIVTPRIVLSERSCLE